MYRLFVRWSASGGALSLFVDNVVVFLVPLIWKGKKHEQDGGFEEDKN